MSSDVLKRPPAQSPATSVTAIDEWRHLAYCPNCSAKLELLKCKARCPRCGFFQDCSDTIV
jgi:hypothetical protein